MIGELSEMTIAVWENCARRSARAWCVKRDNLDVLEGLHEGLKQFEIGADPIEDEKRYGRSGITSSPCHAQDMAVHVNPPDLAEGAASRPGLLSNHFWR